MDTTLLNLRILAKIPEGGKIYKNKGIFVIEEDLSSPIYRFLRGYTRNKSVEDISECITAAIKTIKDLYSSVYYDAENYPIQHAERNLTIRNLSNSIVQASSGLENLRQTYHRDYVTTSKIDIILNDIKNFIPEIKQFLTL